LPVATTTAEKADVAVKKSFFFTMKHKKIVQSLLQEADVAINGNNPYDIQVHNEDLYKRALGKGTLGFGEAYMDGWWDVDALDDFFMRVLQADLEEKIQSPEVILAALHAKLINLQSQRRAFKIGEAHYDLGNDLYSAMLDGRMTYTCGYWKNATTLDEAQEAKLELVCKKIGLKEGDRVLDIGCGWGSFLKYAAEKYGIEGVGITVSGEQVELARKSCSELPIEIRLQDYRDVDETFDHIVSLGMFEHVGVKNYREYMQMVNRCLKDNGLFLLHTIGGNTSVTSTDPWIGKYIFPNSMLPSLKQIMETSEGIFIVEDLHNFGKDYDKTLMAWYDNFEESWNTLKQNPAYDERFYRMWKYYLLSCAATFRSRKNQLWQIVFSKKGVSQGYQSIR